MIHITEMNIELSHAILMPRLHYTTFKFLKEINSPELEKITLDFAVWDGNCWWVMLKGATGMRSYFLGLHISKFLAENKNTLQ